MTKRLVLLALPLLACLCCVAGTVGAIAPINHSGWYGYSPDYGPGDGEPPEGGNCDNAGVAYPDNPFGGWPVDYEPEWGLVTFYYCNIYPDGSPHWGVDLAVPEGTTILVTTDRAIVRQVVCPDNEYDCWNYGMGRYVQIEAQIRVDDYDACVESHAGDTEADDCWINSGWLATYMHLESATVSDSQIVHRGEALGFTGNSGNSNGAHLHYQLNSPAVGAVDPAPSMFGE